MCEKAKMIKGILTLNDDLKIVPSSGLKAQSHRVELAMHHAPEKGWFALVIVTDMTPWYPGESRNVRIEIMSEDFKEMVIADKPALLVKRGAEIIGELQEVQVI